MGIKQEIEWFDPRERLPEIDRPLFGDKENGTSNIESVPLLVIYGKDMKIAVAVFQVGEFKDGLYSESGMSWFEYEGFEIIEEVAFWAYISNPQNDVSSIATAFTHSSPT